MSYVRPAPPITYQDAHRSNLINEVNNKNLSAGPGILLEKMTSGTRISIDPSYRPNVARINYRGTYDFSASYCPGDLVYVDPLKTYTDQDGTTLSFDADPSSSNAPISGGLFICSYPVPDLNMDSSSLFIVSSEMDYVPEDVANSFRNYEQNIYYPVYPTIPSESVTWVTGSNYTSVANYTFWAPISPMIKSQICDETGARKIVYINGVVSDSVFYDNWLPYQPPS